MACGVGVGVEVGVGVVGGGVGTGVGVVGGGVGTAAAGEHDGSLGLALQSTAACAREFRF